MRARRRGQLPNPMSLMCQPQQASGVALQDERPRLGSYVELAELGEPSVRRDERIIRAEQRLASQWTAERADQLGREAARRPAGKVDEDVRLVGGDRDGRV